MTRYPDANVRPAGRFEDMTVLAGDEDGDHLTLLVESRAERAGSSGVRDRSAGEDRPEVALGGLCSFRWSCTLVWRKR